MAKSLEKRTGYITYKALEAKEGEIARQAYAFANRNRGFGVKGTDTVKDWEFTLTLLENGYSKTEASIIKTQLKRFFNRHQTLPLSKPAAAEAPDHNFMPTDNATGEGLIEALLKEKPIVAITTKFIVEKNQERLAGTTKKHIVTQENKKFLKLLKKEVPWCSQEDEKLPSAEQILAKIERSIGFDVKIPPKPEQKKKSIPALKPIEPKPTITKLEPPVKKTAYVAPGKPIVLEEMNAKQIIDQCFSMATDKESFVNTLVEHVKSCAKAIGHPDAKRTRATMETLLEKAERMDQKGGIITACIRSVLENGKEQFSDKERAL